MVKAVIVLVLAFIAYRVVRVLIVRTFEREIEESDPMPKRTREQRMRTLASLLSSIAGVFIFVIAILTALRQFLEIGPVLARSTASVISPGTGPGPCLTSAWRTGKMSTASWR
jgi:small-conductance mechanosensitive channel